MNTSHRLYETTVLINASLEDPHIEACISRIQELITKDQGEIKAVNKWGRKRLAYPIQKKNNGYYVNIEFDAPGSTPRQLEQSYLLDENILRFLTIQVSKKALQAREISRQKPVAEEVVVPPKEVAEFVREPLFEDETSKNAS